MKSLVYTDSLGKGNSTSTNTFINPYRYGFNGKEKDDEVSGAGDEYDYGARMYDARLGRFTSVDPLFKEYPWWTPYQFAGNHPVSSVDIDGMEPEKQFDPSAPWNSDVNGHTHEENEEINGRHENEGGDPSTHEENQWWSRHAPTLHVENNESVEERHGWHSNHDPGDKPARDNKKVKRGWAFHLSGPHTTIIEWNLGHKDKNILGVDRADAVGSGQKGYHSLGGTKQKRIERLDRRAKNRKKHGITNEKTDRLKDRLARLKKTRNNYFAFFSVHTKKQNAIRRRQVGKE